MNNKNTVVVLIVTLIIMLSGCGGSSPLTTGTAKEPPPDSLVSPTIDTDIKGPLPDFLVNPTIESEISFKFDPLSGIDLYTALENMYGQGSLQTPDLYENNHVDVKHISWVEDAQSVENAEYLRLSLDIIDNERNTAGTPTRQRNEISIINEAGLCFYGQSMNHEWRMYIESQTHISSSFSHFAQLLNNGASHAALTLTGRRKNGVELLQVLYTTDSKKDEVIASVSWADVIGRWLNIQFAYTCAEADEGTLYLRIDSEGKSLVEINNTDIDMWHGSNNIDDYQRFKFGYYRKIRDTTSSDLKNGLTEQTESIRLIPIRHQKLR